MTLHQDFPWIAHKTGCTHVNQTKKCCLTNVPSADPVWFTSMALTWELTKHTEGSKGRNCQDWNLSSWLSHKESITWWSPQSLCLRWSVRWGKQMESFSRKRRDKTIEVKEGNPFLFITDKFSSRESSNLLASSKHQKHQAFFCCNTNIHMIKSFSSLHSTPSEGGAKVDRFWVKVREARLRWFRHQGWRKMVKTIDRGCKRWSCQARGNDEYHREDLWWWGKRTLRWLV